MPKAAIAINAADEVLPLDTIPETVIKIFQR
jgi:chemotaxis response regulator CheB